MYHPLPGKRLGNAFVSAMCDLITCPGKVNKRQPRAKKDTWWSKNGRTHGGRASGRSWKLDLQEVVSVGDGIRRR